jgi:hypothetical protein
MLSDLTATSFKLSDFVKPQTGKISIEENKSQKPEGHSKTLEYDKDVHLLLCWAY